MGCTSAKYVVNINLEGQGLDCQKVLNALKLAETEVNRLYRCFLKYDLSGDGKLSIIEFLTMLDEDETILTREIFNENNSEENILTFKEFVLAVWRYCVLDKKQIAEMIFELFDTDHSLELSDSEVKKLITAMYGKKGVQHDINRLLKSINQARQGVITKKEFLDSALKNPVLLFPAYHLQKLLQEKICGQEFWFNQFSRAHSILNTPEVQQLYQKSNRKNVATVTPIHQQAVKSNKIGDDSLVIIDFGASAASEKKRSPVRHAASVGDSPHGHTNVSPASVSQSSQQSNDHSPAGSSKGHRHAIIHKQHTTGDIPDPSPARSRHRGIIPKQHSLEADANHSSPHQHHNHQHESKSSSSKNNHQPVHKQHITGNHSVDHTESSHTTGKMSSKSSKTTKGSDEWVTASRKEILY